MRSVNIQFFVPPPNQTSGTEVKPLIDAFQQGKLDLVSSIGLGDYEGVPASNVVVSPGISLLQILFNQRPVAPNAKMNGGASMFRDRSVRKAFIEAFDRCGMFISLKVGSCDDPNLRTDEGSVPEVPGWDKTITQPGYNPSDAAHLMDAAGYKVVQGVRMYQDGKTPIQLTIPSLPNSHVIALKMAHDYMTNLQIQVTVTIPDNIGKAWASGAFDITLYNSGPSNGAIISAYYYLAAYFQSAQIPPIGANYGGVQDTFIDQQLMNVTTAFDTDQQIVSLQAVLRQIANQSYLEPLFVDPQIRLTKHSIGNFLPSPGNTDFWNIADWYRLL